MSHLQQTEYGRAQPLFQAELEAYYAQYPTDVSSVEAGLEQRLAQKPEASAFEKKRWVYEAVSQHCRVKLFHYCPFYYEVDTGSDRNLCGSAFPAIPGLGSWVMRTDPTGLEAEFDAWRLPYMERSILYTTMYADFAHNAMAVENVLKNGFAGMQKQAEAQLRAGVGNADFLRSAVAACQCVKTLGQRFTQEAERMLAEEVDPEAAKRLSRISVSAAKCPWQPAETFFEALNTLWYLKELANAVDSAGVAILGHVDRLLYPYYLRDIEAGRLTREEAQDLIYWFCSMIDTKWDLTRAIYGTNTSMNIGGCDRTGAPVFNDVTRMVVQAYLDLKLINPKLQARVPKEADPEYLQLISRVAASGLNVLSVFNDDVILKAQMRMDKALEDVRCYVNGGCQEVLLADTEFNSRAYCYLSPAKYLEMMLCPQKDGFFAQERIVPKELDGCTDFEELSDRVFANMALIIHAIAWHFNGFEARWPEHSPFPLMSATYEGCMRQGRDLTEGGAEYNDSSFALVGIGSFIDSMFAIRETVFKQKRYTLAQLVQMLQNNFEGCEEERLYLRNKVAKYGDDTEEINAFARDMLNRMAVAMAHMRNARGGLYEASVWSFYGYEWMKAGCGALPCGRLAGEHLSRGVNPAETTQTGITAMIHTFGQMDCSRFPQTAVSYFTLPIADSQGNVKLCESLIRYFVECNGSSADFDLLDGAAIQDALLHPEAHGDLVIRVCGYSARFVDLEPDMQKEIASRFTRL